MRWRGVVLILVFVCGLTALLAGVAVTERPEVAGDGLLAKIYYTIGLFVLGGLDLGTPIGGAPWARALLWIAYFAAPAVTASAVIEGLLRAVNPNRLWRWRLRHHIVIVGCGRLAALYVARLRQRHKRLHIVMVESEANKPELSMAQRRYNAQVVVADVLAPGVLESLRLERATRLLLLTGDDHTNLDAASRVAEIAPNLVARMVIHVSDLRLVHVLQKANLLQDATIFNSHGVAAEHLVDTRIRRHFEETTPRDTVVLAGFGRFGQTVLNSLQRSCAGTFDRVLIVDTRAESRALHFDEQVGFSEDYQYEIVEAELLDPKAWRGVLARLDLAVAPVFVVGTGDDSVNLRVSLALAAHAPGALIIARCFARSAFSSHVARECAFELVAVSELIERSMPDAWFER